MYHIKGHLLKALCKSVSLKETSQKCISLFIKINYIWRRFSCYDRGGLLKRFLMVGEMYNLNLIKFGCMQTLLKCVIIFPIHTPYQSPLSLPKSKLMLHVFLFRGRRLNYSQFLSSSWYIFLGSYTIIWVCHEREPIQSNCLVKLHQTLMFKVSQLIQNVNPCAEEHTRKHPSFNVASVCWRMADAIRNTSRCQSGTVTNKC